MSLTPPASLRLPTRAPRVALALAAMAGILAVAPSVASASTTPPAECAEVSSPATTDGVIADAELATFGPISSHPVVDITLSAGEVVNAERVTGGTVVSSYLGGEQQAIDFVEDGGVVRWRRCFAGAMPVVGPSTDGHGWILLFMAGEDGASEIRLLDATTGADAELPEGFPTGAGATVWSDGHVLVGSGPVDGPAASRTYSLVDLTTLAVTPVPVPDQVASGEVEFPGYTLTADGVVGFSGEDRYFATLGIFVAGVWSSDPAAIDAAMPITIGVDDWDTMELVAHSGSGATLWTAPGVTAPGHEGFHDVTVGDVTLLSGCTEHTAEGICASESLLALDAATGKLRWTLPGYRTVYATGDGYALLNEEWVGAGGSSDPRGPDIVMIDLATGQPVEGQRWSGDTFFMGCCADMSFTTNDGGVVITSDVTSLQVFLPVAFESLETAIVRL